LCLVALMFETLFETWGAPPQKTNTPTKGTKKEALVLMGVGGGGGGGERARERESARARVR